MLKKLSTLLGSILAFILLTVPGAGLAGEVTDFVEFKNPLAWDTLNDLVGAVLGMLVAIAIPVAVVMFLLAGVKFIRAGASGNSGEIKKAKMALLWTMVGLAILASLSGIMYMVNEFFLGEKQAQEAQIQYQIKEPIIND